MDSVLISGFFSVLALISWALFLFAAFAFVDAAARRQDAFPAADKRTKGFWLIILGIAAVVIALVALQMLSMLSFLPVIAVIPVILYMVDVRPAVRAISGRGSGVPRSLRRRNRGGSSSDGPYGPYNGGR